MSLLSGPPEHFQAGLSAAAGGMWFSDQIKGPGKGSKCHPIHCLRHATPNWSFSFCPQAFGGTGHFKSSVQTLPAHLLVLLRTRIKVVFFFFLVPSSFPFQSTELFPPPCISSTSPEDGLLAGLSAGWGGDRQEAQSLNSAHCCAAFLGGTVTKEYRLNRLY